MSNEGAYQNVLKFRDAIFLQITDTNLPSVKVQL